jgi:hypothetical protein
MRLSPRSLHIFTLTVLIAATGCISKQQPVPRKQVSGRITLETAIRTATAKRLDMRVHDALQQIAKEHVEKRRLLDLPGMTGDLSRRLPTFTVETDYRITILDRAVDTCRILMTRQNKDINLIQEAVEKRKIALEQAIFWSKLDYVNTLKASGIPHPGLENAEKDITLELTISAGIPQEMIRRFDYTSLPSPQPIKEEVIPEYISNMLKSYKDAPESALRFADIVYRLPAELLHRSESDCRAAFQLAQGAATAISGKILKKYRQDALARYLRAGKRLMRSDDVKIKFAREQAKLAWRIAYFKELYTKSPYPASPDKKELTFLSDLISLQEK